MESILIFVFRVLMLLIFFVRFLLRFCIFVGSLRVKVKVLG